MNFHNNEAGFCNVVSDPLSWLSMLTHRLDTDNVDLANIRKMRLCEEDKKTRLNKERLELEQRQQQILKEIEENSRASERANVAIQICSEILNSGKI